MIAMDQIKIKTKYFVMNERKRNNWIASVMEDLKAKNTRTQGKDGKTTE